MRPASRNSDPAATRRSRWRHPDDVHDDEGHGIALARFLPSFCRRSSSALARDREPRTTLAAEAVCLARARVDEEDGNAPAASPLRRQELSSLKRRRLWSVCLETMHSQRARARASATYRAGNELLLRGDQPPWRWGLIQGRADEGGAQSRLGPTSMGCTRRSCIPSRTGPMPHLAALLAERGMSHSWAPAMAHCPDGSLRGARLCLSRWLFQEELSTSAIRGSP